MCGVVLRKVFLSLEIVKRLHCTLGSSIEWRSAPALADHLVGGDPVLVVGHVVLLVQLGVDDVAYSPHGEGSDADPSDDAEDRHRWGVLDSGSGGGRHDAWEGL